MIIYPTYDNLLAMAEETKLFIKSNWITLANLILLLSIVVSQAKWQQSVDSRLTALESHVTDKEVHMPFAEKIKIFVPRVELDARLNNIDKSLIRIEGLLNK